MKMGIWWEASDVGNSHRQLLEGQQLESFMKGIYEPEGQDIQPIATTYEIHDLEKVVTGESKPIVKLSNLILTDAIDARASDVHIEPLINMVKIRYRVDGVMQEHLTLPKWAQNAIVSRFKVIANLDIALRRAPQDGRLNLIYKKRTIDLRVSTLPTHYGEKVVMRILDHDRAIPALADLGLSGRNLSVMESAFRAPQGLVLTTGPTGSGKTSTLYASIQGLRTGAKNIVTVEDPIEFQMHGVNQVQVNERANLTFASALRSILRQDPDVVMLGEIRDRETADIAFQAAQTGHMVLSSLHTNDSLSTVTRLNELGIESYLVAECTLVIMAQRLARRNCQECLTTYNPDPDDLKRLSLTESTMEYRGGTGCDACRNTGFDGRIGLFEVLAIDPSMTELIIKGANAVELRAAAVRSGMKFINEDAIVKIGEGLTTPEEVLRVIFLEEEFQFRCPSCTRSIDPDFAICPFCRFELKIMCPACGIELNPEWTHCPHCRASLNSAPAPLQPPEPAAEAPTIEINDVDEPPVVVGAPPSPAVSQQPAPAEAATPKQTGPAPAQTSVVENPGGPIGQLPGQLTDILVPDGRFRVLIIDDDIVTCNLITLLMRRFEFQTTAVIANDGQQAFQKIEEEVPHLIVLDLLMPEMDGYEFLAKLRRELKTAFIPVIVITQTRQEETQKLAKQHGADAYLNKPLDPQDLEKCMKGLLSRIYGI
ncbi:MAG: ATPase, T2SS/T4P/T4SS family [Planctomycetota bacterium]|jgi:type II secretory ATPase GspE/PulE/Tfp pilus assembly ATPase PilB-like protein/ActR/RegA family two-component response regulator|nr:ATPase, T2SS/T4P/T4SS family [Planctomycetota bacterium]